MQLVDAFVRNPVKIAVATLMVVLFGYIALVSMPMQLTPEVETPTITIETRWPGASPEEIEQEIIVEQEEQLSGVEDVTKMSSESTDSMGTITLEFTVGTDMEAALLQVNSRLQQVREYPIDADQPVITTANSSNQAIAWFILSPRRPTDEEFDKFTTKYPELASKLQGVRTAHNVGLAMLRLRQLAAEQPEFAELLPPPDLDVTKLRRFAEEEIEARFERVSGVAQSNVMGGLDDELQVIVDPEKLAARQLTLSQVRDVLRFQNSDVSAGDFWEGKRRYVVRVPGQFRSPAQVEEQLLANRGGAPVFVRDVAEVKLGFKKPDGLVRRFGESSIAINCIRKSDANVLDVMEGLRQSTKEINREILQRRGLQLSQVYDETEYIYSAVDLVTEDIFLGGALTMIVLMTFLHLSVRTLLAIPFILGTSLAAMHISPWYFGVCLLILVVTGLWFARGALVVGVVIPVSIIGTFMVLHALARSLNVISLAGLAFAVGMFVDNAVVVLENIYRRYSLGESPHVAAVRGTQEVWGAVTAATLTNIAIFVPVVFVKAEAGQLFTDMALAISGALALSLFVSVLVIPAAAARLLKRSSADPDLPKVEPRALGNGHPHVSFASNEAAQPSPKPVDHSWSKRITDGIVAPIEAMASAFVNLVVAINRWLHRGVLRRLATVFVLVGVSAGVSWLLWPKVEYLPTGNRNLAIGILLPPPGYNTDHMMAIGDTVEASLRPYWDIDPNDPKLADLDGPAIADYFFVVRGRSVFLGLRALDETRAGDLVPLMQRISAQLPGVIALVKQTSLFEQGLASGRTVDIEITGPNIEQLIAFGGEVFGKVKQTIPTAQAFPRPSLDLSSPEVHVQPKLVQAAEMGMNTSDIGFAVNALIDGAYVSDYFLGGKKIDLTVKGKEEWADHTQKIAALPVATPVGQLVPLSALVTAELSSGPEQINHRERERAITIAVSPPPEMALEDAMQTIQSQIVAPMIDSGRLDGGYHMALEGTADKLRETWESLRYNILLAVIITYLMMAAMFESWLYPFVIILSVPLGAVGGIVGLKLLNLAVLQPLDVLTMLGFVILVGTVVNNPILIVHQSLNHMREDGMSPREAIIESTRTRIRPIFVTTITTVLGLLPLVLIPGAGSELYRGLGSVYLGGLVVSTIFTLVLVPSLFSLTLEAKEGLLNRFWRDKPALAAVPVAKPRRAAAVSELQSTGTN